MQDEPEAGACFSHKMSLKGRTRILGIDHQHARRKEIKSEEIQASLEASEEVRFHARDRGELSGWINQILRQQDYGRLKRRGRGLVRQYWRR
jgi:hypothetical protein